MYLALSNGTPFNLSTGDRLLIGRKEKEHFNSLFVYVRDALQANPEYTNKIVFTSKDNTLEFEFQENKYLLSMRYVCLNSNWPGVGVYDKVRLDILLTFGCYVPLKSDLGLNANTNCLNLLKTIISIIKRYNGPFIRSSSPQIRSDSDLTAPVDNYRLWSLNYNLYLDTEVK